MQRRIAIVLFLLFVTARALLPGGTALAAGASGDQVTPSEVVLFVQSDLRNKRYIALAVCALERALEAPVRVETLDVPLTGDLLARPGQYDALKVANRFLAATAADNGGRLFKYFLMAEDITYGNYNYLFAQSYGDATTQIHMGLLSVARLASIGHEPATGAAPADLVAQRILKILFRSIAQTGGYRTAQGCVLAFPNSLASLDQKPVTFCPDDRAALVATGLLRPEERERCGVLVSEALPVARARR